MPKGRGPDFELRLISSQWAEKVTASAMRLRKFSVFQVGISNYIPEAQRLQKQTNSKATLFNAEEKDPDFVVFERSAVCIPGRVTGNALSIEQKNQIRKVARKAYCAIEVKFTAYRAREMKGRHWTPPKRKRTPKVAQAPTAPNVWIKDHELSQLAKWQRKYKCRVLVIHVFAQEAFAIAIDKLLEARRIMNALGNKSVAWRRWQFANGIFYNPTYRYDRTDAQGASEEKAVWMTTPFASTKAADVIGIRVSAKLRISKSKRYFAGVVFSRGHLRLTDKFVDLVKVRKR